MSTTTLVNLPIFIVGVDQVIRWPLLLPKATCERGGKRGQQIKKRKRKLQATSFKQQATLDNGSGIM
jgi:hypothetical protein